MHWVTTVSKFSLLYCFVIFITDHDPTKKPPLTTAFMPSGGLQQFTIMFIFIFILHIAFVLFSFFCEYILFYFATDEPGVCGLWWLSWGSGAACSAAYSFEFS